MKNWVRLRFKTKHGDHRPAVFNPKYPWWCSGYDADNVSIIVAYLPISESLEKYWDDAYEIQREYVSNITFNGRFQKPEWFEAS